MAYTQISDHVAVWPLLSGLVFIFIWVYTTLTKDKRLLAKLRSVARSSEKQALQSSIDPTESITPLWNFDLQATEPIPYRPYEFQGHVTMGIQRRERQDWIRMDKGYTQRIRDRKTLIETQPQYTIGTGPLVNEAIEELYQEIMIDYLPKRFPTMFQRRGAMVLNRVTGSSYPLSTSGQTPERMLQLLGKNVEEDFYFMCPDEYDGEFQLRGYIACFPGGFLSPARVGESVREIRKPVPGYEENLGKSVDRYFQRMQPGQFIGRPNMSICPVFLALKLEPDLLRL